MGPKINNVPFESFYKTGKHCVKRTLWNVSGQAHTCTLIILVSCGSHITMHTEYALEMLQTIDHSSTFGMEFALPLSLSLFFLLDKNMFSEVILIAISFGPLANSFTFSWNWQ